MYSENKRFLESFIIWGLVTQDHVKAIGYGFLVAELQSQNFKSDYNTEVILSDHMNYLHSVLTT